MRLALALGERGRRAVVINADSAQVYGDLAVLSARPTAAEMRGVEHRLFGTWDGASACSAAAWAAAVAALVDETHAREAISVLVGGTGLYWRTLLEGIAPVPEIDPAVRAAVRAMPVAETYAALQYEDPARAAALSPNDTTRVARALEVVRATGRPLAAWQAERRGGIGERIALHPAVLLPERQWLYERCEARFAAMLAGGAIGEVEVLLARGLDPDLPVMRAIGVPEIAGYLRGEWALAEAQTRGAQATRNYVKRQTTWLRHQCPPEWPLTETFPYDEMALFGSLFHELGLT